MTTPTYVFFSYIISFEYICMIMCLIDMLICLFVNYLLSVRKSTLNSNLKAQTDSETEIDQFNRLIEIFRTLWQI